MSTSDREATRQELLQRIAELERVKTHLVEELATVRREQVATRSEERAPLELLQEQGTALTATTGHPAGVRPGAMKQGPTEFDSQTDQEAVFALNTDSGPALSGQSIAGLGVKAESIEGDIALLAIINDTGVSLNPEQQFAVFAHGRLGANGLLGKSDSTGVGVTGISGFGIGVHAVGGGAIPATPGKDSFAVLAEGGKSVGVWATSDSDAAVVGNSGSGIGVSGMSTDSFGVAGQSNTSFGVAGFSENTIGVVGESTSGAGVFGESTSGPGVAAFSTTGPALFIIGHVLVEGDAVGQAMLVAGQTSVVVMSNAATANSNVLLTPLSDPQGRLWVTTAAGSFTIQSSTAPTSDVTIAYLIIN